MQWKPIESAPKDGTKVLLWANRVGWERNGFNIVAGRYSENTWWIYGAEHRSNIPMGHKDTCQPTHWMPLPYPPTDEFITLPRMEME